ncbi:MAG: DNA starvation/stationary phase protection protein [Treponema sp.]|nr:DNA starvation/stationary phase protection protein [Treponema sp.]
MDKELAKKLNNYLANLGVEYVKLHNLHWNVVGANFKGAHEYLEELYDEVTEYLDEIAELLRMNDELPLASLKDYLANATIKEIDSKEMSVKDAMQVALGDLEALQAQAVETLKYADSIDSIVVSDALTGQIKDYTKKIWFIKSMVK